MPHLTDSEAELKRIFKLQHDLGRVMADMVDPTAGLSAALTMVAAEPEIAGVWIWFLGDESDAFELRGSAGVAERHLVALDLLPADTELAARLLAGKEACGDPTVLLPEGAATWQAAGWTQVVLLPVASAGQVVGAVGAAEVRQEVGAVGAARAFPEAGAHGAERACQEFAAGNSCLWVLRTLAAATGAQVASIRHETRQRTGSRNMHRILDSFADPLLVVARDGRIVHGNAAACCYHPGLADACVAVGEVLPDFAAFQWGTDGDAGGPGHPPTARRTVMRDRTGRDRPVEAQVTTARWDDEPAAIVVCREIAAQLELADERECLVTAINQLVEAIVITDADAKIEYVNPAFTTLTGWEQDEVLGQNPRLIKSDAQPPSTYADMWATLTAGRTWHGNLVNRRKDGTLFTEQTTINPVRDGTGAISHFVAVKRDITGESALEERLRETQKMEALGTLAGGIAHDFNNILYALLGYVDLALDDIPAGNPAHAAVQEIGKAGNRAAALVAKMLRFGRRSTGGREATDLAAVVDESLGLLRAALPDSVTIRTELRTGIPTVLADPAQMQHVLVNLCSNAGHAMGDRGGDLVIGLDEVRTSVPAEHPDDPHGRVPRVRLTVTDTGCGIEPEAIGRIFEPYYSSRKAHEGTGLGLATVHSIIRSHGGTIEVASQPGAGSTFTILLPPYAALKAAPEVADEPGCDARPGERGRVLVVDDEPMVADVIRRSLQRLGYVPRVCHDGETALQHFAADPDGWDAVISDQTMPGMGGVELAARILARRPAMPVILATGYCSPETEAEARALGIRHFLTKPLKIRDLGELLAGLVTPAPCRK